MHLHLARSHARTFFGGHRYTISAQLECSAEDHAIITAHDFLSTRIYTAPIADDFTARADAAYERQRKMSVLNSDDQLPIIWENIKAVTLYSRAANAFHIEVRGLLNGCTITCSSLADLLVAERDIVAAFETMSRLVAHAHAFDQGTETVLVPDAHNDTPTTSPPSAWPIFSRS